MLPCDVLQALKHPVKICPIFTQFHQWFRKTVHQPIQNRDVLGQDPFGEPALKNQLKLIEALLRAVYQYKKE